MYLVHVLVNLNMQQRSLVGWLSSERALSMTRPNSLILFGWAKGSPLQKSQDLDALPSHSFKEPSFKDNCPNPGISGRYQKERWVNDMRDLHFPRPYSLQLPAPR